MTNSTFYLLIFSLLRSWRVQNKEYLPLMLFVEKSKRVCSFCFVIWGPLSYGGDFVIIIKYLGKVEIILNFLTVKHFLLRGLIFLYLLRILSQVPATAFIVAELFNCCFPFAKWPQTKSSLWSVDQEMEKN